MAQNTPQDVSEEIIDLVEIIQKGKVPRPREDASINFDQVLSDLHGGDSSAVPDNPLLEDLLADLEKPAAPSAADAAPQTSAAEASFDDLLAGLEMPAPDLDAKSDEPAGESSTPVAPAMPEVPSFESLFADLGLGGDNGPAPGKPAAPVAQPANEPEPSDAAEAMEQIPGFEDVDALISKLDVPPSGGSPKPGAGPDAGELLNALGSNGAPADLDSLLDSLLTAGGPRTPQAKAAQGQPKEISEADLDDLLSSIEVESGGKAAPVAPPAPESMASSAPSAEAALPPLIEAVAEPTAPEAPAADSIDDLFKSLDAETPLPTTAPTTAGDAMSEMDLDALLAGIESPTPSPAAAATPVPPVAAEPGASQAEASHDDLLEGETAPVPAADDAAETTDAKTSEASSELESAPQSPSLAPAAQRVPETPETETLASPEPVSATETPLKDAGEPAPVQTAMPSLADLLSGKVELDVPDEPDALDELTGFPETADKEGAPAGVADVPGSDPDVPAVEPVVEPAAPMAEAGVDVAAAKLAGPAAQGEPGVQAEPAAQAQPAASSPADALVDDLTPEDVLADVDVLVAESTAVVSTASATASAAGGVDQPPFSATPSAAAFAVSSPVNAASGVELERLDEVEQRMAMLEAELTLLQNRVDALETATESEQLQDKVLDALSDDTPLRVQLLDLMQTAAQQTAAGRDERMHKSQTEFEARVTALEERQRDVEWGREEGLTMLEQRLVELEQRLDASERLQALEERLALLENQPADNLEDRVSVLETLPLEALEERVTALESRHNEDLGQRLAQLEQHMQSLSAESPEEKTRKLIEAMRADIERAAAESAARVLREEIAALLNEH